MSTGINSARVAPEQLGGVFHYGFGPLRPLTDIELAAHEIHKFSPNGADSILIGLSSFQGIKIEEDQQGIIAVLIGLTLPAMERLLGDMGSFVPHYLQTALRAGGSIGFLMGDGSVRHADGTLGGVVKTAMQVKQNTHG